MSEPLADWERQILEESDVRHHKWHRVEPGHSIPVGQPYRVEYGDYAEEDRAQKVLEVPKSSKGSWFVDSSWKPPLVLPTESTWGIAVCPKPKLMDTGAHDEPFAMVGRWARYDSDPDILTRTNRDFQTRFDTLDVDFLTDFIPLTDEQVARIEAAR